MINKVILFIVAVNLQLSYVALKVIQIPVAVTLSGLEAMEKCARRISDTLLNEVDRP